MSSGKKGKKKKGVTVDLMTFLGDDRNGPSPNMPSMKSSNWADDVEDDHEGYSSRSNKDPVILPTAPRAARGPGIDEENIPTNPPYVAYLSNLPYDVTELDLADFFGDTLKVSHMRLPKDANKIRGYGYVEFEDRQSLIDALSMTNTTIKTRRVRIEVSNSSNDDRRGGRMGRDSRRDNYDDPERTSGDWRSGPREELPEGDSYRSRYDRDRRDDRERYDYDNKPGAWRERDSNDKGSSFKDRGGFRDDSKEREWNRFGDRGRSKDRDGDRGSSFGPRRNYGDSDWERNRQQDRNADQDSKRESEPRQRPKLQLQPRTKPVEPIAVAEDAPAKEDSKDSTDAKQDTSTRSDSAQRAPAPVPAANIFGAAKPVDTTAREREIEERLAKSRSREETGDKDNKERKDGTWSRRNGEGREDKERSRPTWRSEEERGARLERSAPRTQRSEEQNGSKASPASRAPPTSKGPQKSSDKDARNAPERDRKDKEKDEISRMPKAKDEQAPNFVASNKYSMLPDDVDPDNIDE